LIASGDERGVVIAFEEAELRQRAVAALTA
jgi:hypothetical protein